MARRDKTGPMGEGPMTGRGLGICSGSKKLAVAAGLGMSGLGLGLACRRGMGFSNEESSETPEEILTRQKELLQDRLDLINAELEKL